MPQRTIRAKSNGGWLRDAKVWGHLDKDMRMNNEPVAWVDEINTFLLDKDYKQLPKTLQNGMSPLYPHPAKTLTDEEILESFAFYFGSTLNNKAYNDGAILFAKDILKKAQEK